MLWRAWQFLSKRFLKHLGLGACAILLTVFLALAASPTIARIPRLDDTSDALTAQSSTTNGSQLFQQGKIFYDTGQFARAAAIWTQAAAAFAAQGNNLNQAMVLRNLALAYQQLGQLSKANETIDDSLNLLNRFETLTNNGLGILAQALNTKGSLQLAQGQSEAALKTWEQATEIYAQLDNPEGVARSLINRAIALRLLGFHPQAEQQLTRVNQIILKQQTDPLLQAAMLRNLGDVQRSIGNLGQSCHFLRESLEITPERQASSNSSVTSMSFDQAIALSTEESCHLLREKWKSAKHLSSSSDVSATLMSVGNTLHALAQITDDSAQRTGDLEEQTEAKTLYQEAQKWYAQSAATAPSRLAKLQAQLNQLSLAVKLQSWPEVRKLWGNIQDEINHIPLSQPSIYAQIGLAQSLMNYRQQVESCNRATSCPSIEKIQQILSSADQNAKTLEDQRAESYALGYLGHFYEQQVKPEPGSNFSKLDKHNIQEAHDLTEEALIIVQANGARDIAYRWQWQLGRLYTLQRKSDKALAAYGAAFRNVRDLRNDLLFLTSDIQFIFRDRIEPLYREYVSLLLPPASNGTSVGGISQAEITSLVVMDDLRLAELENFLACSIFTGPEDEERVSIDEVAKDEGQTAIIYPIILKDRMEVLLKLPGQGKKLYRHTIYESQEDIEKKLQQLRYSLEQPYFSSRLGKSAAIQLYDWLIRPAEKFIDPKHTKTLVFILDGSLRNIPMAALYDGEQYLIQKYAVAIALGGLKLPKSPPAKTQFRALIAGLSEKPQFQNPDLDEFGPLKFVKQEVEAVQAILPKSKVLLNEAFTTNALQTEINTAPYNVVHLATHGQFGFSRENTFILTAPNEPDDDIDDIKADLNKLDNLLKVRDQSPIDLLVLSACETATGDEREVLGIAGMAVQTGARSTLASLWSIDDSSTAKLMQKFYQELTEKQVTKAEALRQAQLELLRKPLAYKPVHWAPYVLVGDWR